jgi:hypothetical protein
MTWPVTHTTSGQARQGHIPRKSFQKYFISDLAEMPALIRSWSAG